MNEHDATEVAYKNGYRAGAKDLAERLKDMPSVMNCEYEWLHNDIDNLVAEMTEGKVNEN